MAKHTPEVTGEVSPERVKSKKGVGLSSLDEKDLNKDRDKNRPTPIKEPDNGKKEIEEPPPPKTKR